MRFIKKMLITEIIMLIILITICAIAVAQNDMALLFVGSIAIIFTIILICATEKTKKHYVEPKSKKKHEEYEEPNPEEELEKFYSKDAVDGYHESNTIQLPKQ